MQCYIRKDGGLVISTPDGHILLVALRLGSLHLRLQQVANAFDYAQRQPGEGEFPFHEIRGVIRPLHISRKR